VAAPSSSQKIPATPPSPDLEIVTYSIPISEQASFFRFLIKQ